MTSSIYCLLIRALRNLIRTVDRIVDSFFYWMPFAIFNIIISVFLHVAPRIRWPWVKALIAPPLIVGLFTVVVVAIVIGWDWLRDKINWAYQECQNGKDKP